MEKPVNALSLTGTIAHMPEFSHDVFGEPFYQLTLAVPRLSGVHDMLPVTASQRLLDMVSPAQDMPLHLEGQVRSYNKMIDGVGRLLITAFAQRLAPPEGNENPNTVLLCGALCKPPAYRTTPFGREIADLMLAVNRAFGKSDYIPCIAWGRNARFAAQLTVGDRLMIEGRLQSRPYQKQLPDGTVLDKIAYEVSIGRLETERPEGSPAENRFSTGE
ncbi:MAG TPA: single-stranded DNA-binding protein [Candidatus Avichristensenella intestinipullorum]|uniref:Single-stranded DNA-binding protein n=1 Tax=Candidatus Avichristensenella intestinipullorum TaxID=2840693 RepID=A0A9D1CHM9_9FIRM|nr:single-stranded DNA-binding protein [Candidatus Avichristensenella intestinipullorum]